MPSRSPRYDRVTEPDKIINAPDLNPQAQVVGSPYEAPTRANVAEVPKSNQLMQLGAALGQLEPTMQRGTAMWKEKHDEAEVEAANAQWAESKKQLGDATRTGKIPPGQSQLFNDTWRALDAKDIADQYQPALWQAWSQEPDATNPDKPNAFAEFRQKFRADWDSQHLRDPETGNAKFTPHQLMTAKYEETLNAHDNSLTTHNTNVRIAQLTEKGKDTLNKNIQTTVKNGMLDLAGQPLSPEQIPWTNIAKGINEAVRGQTTGLVTTGGLPPHLATEVTATAVAQLIMDSKDISIGSKVGAAMDALDPAHPITGTAKWKSILQTATEHATAQVTQARRNQVFEADRLAQGGDDAIAARTKEVTAIADSEREVNWHTKADANIILSPKDLVNPTPEEAQKQGEAFARLFKYNPDKAQFLTKQIRDLKEHVTDRIDKEKYGENEVRIYQAIEKAPGSAGTAELIDQARMDKFIDQPTWQRLRQENKEMGNAAVEYKGILDNKIYTTLEQGVKDGLVDPQKPFGEKSIAAAQAAHEFRMTAISILRRNPGMDAVQLSELMEPKMKVMHLKYNETAKQLQIQRDKDAQVEERIQKGMLTRDQADAVLKHEGQTFKNKNGETVTQTPEQTQQILKATEETNAINKADKQAPARKGPAPEKLGEYMTTQDKTSLVDAVRLAYEPGVDTKPISQGAMRDRVRETLSKHYSDPHELNDATNHIIEKLSSKYKKKVASK